MVYAFKRKQNMFLQNNNDVFIFTLSHYYKILIGNIPQFYYKQIIRMVSHIIGVVLDINLASLM